MAVTTRRYHARELERRTRIRALEGQARLLLNDLNEFEVWTEQNPAGTDDAAERWLHEVYRPTLARIAAAVGPNRDLIQAYCDVLEEKWFLSERSGRDVGLAAAIDAYLALGAPAPEAGRADPTDALDPIDVDELEHSSFRDDAPAVTGAGDAERGDRSATDSLSGDVAPSAE
jgi:hypothetical protein